MAKAKAKTKSKRVTSKTPAKKPAKRVATRAATSKPKNPVKRPAPTIDEKALKAASPAVKGAVYAGKAGVPPHSPADLVKAVGTQTRDAAIELLRRCCAKGQMVVGDKVQPLVDWLTRAGYATTQRQGSTSRLYPTTAGRQKIRNG